MNRSPVAYANQYQNLYHQAISEHQKPSQMKKKNSHYEQENDNQQNSNIPITIKNNTRGRNTTYNNDINEHSLDSPIKRLKFSRQSVRDSNPQNQDSNGVKQEEQKKSKKDLRVKDNIRQNKQQQVWPHEEESSQGLNPKQQSENISKIQLGNQKVIQLPVQKASSNHSNSQDQDEINQMASQMSEPNQLPSSQQKYPNQTQKTTKVTINGVPYQQPKRSMSQIPSNFHFSPRFQHKPERPDIKHSRSITDSILSPQFSKYLGQSQSRLRSKIGSPLYPHRGYHHNQYPLMVRSQTLPKPQNVHYRTTFIKQELKLTLANNLEDILFKYNGGHARILYNNKLKIKNDSPVNVELKIMCTSPSHYEVRPYSTAALCPSQVLNVLIEMKLYAQDINQLTMKHDLSRYANDKFKICYWSSEYLPDIWYQSGQKVLPVVIEDTQEQKIRSKGLIENQTNEELKMIAGEKNIEMYKKMIEQTKKKVDIIDFEIRDVNKNKLHMNYFTKTLFWFVAIVGFAIGYWIG